MREQGVDALWTYSKLLQRGEAEWPDARAPARRPGLRRRGLAGDARVHPRRAATPSKPPGEQIADFEEYTRLYRESWSRPRHPLAALDGADRDDLRRPRRQRRLEHLLELGAGDARASRGGRRGSPGAFMAYWIYQHIGNLSPPELDEERTLDVVGGRRRRRARGCGALAHEWDRESAASRWAYYRDFGDSRLLVLDSRAARVLAEGRREMVDEEEWQWIVEHSRGAFDHLVIASTLPVFLPHGIHHLEAWNEALCDGRWGRAAARLSERLRRAVDLEHWAAFNPSFERLCDWLRTVAAGATDAPAPATIVLLGGRRPQRLRQRDRARPRAGRRPRLPGRLLAVPEPALGEGAADRPGDGLARSRVPSSRGWRGSPACRAPSADWRLRSRAGRSTTRSASSCSTAALRGSRSAQPARGRGRRAARRSPLAPSSPSNRRGLNSPGIGSALRSSREAERPPATPPRFPSRRPRQTRRVPSRRRHRA